MKWLSGIALIGVLALSVSAQAQDDSRLESIITGNQEQPQVLYIVPWQTPDSPTLKYDVINNQTNAVFEHLERSELLRELKYLPPLQDLAETVATQKAVEPQSAE
jgi:hypothetical protein